MSASKRKKNDLVTNRFKLEPLSPRVLYSADVQWLSGVHGFQSWTLHDDAQPQYLNSTPAPLVQFAANQPRHEATTEPVSTAIRDVAEKNALLKEVAVVIQPSSDNVITAEQWLNLVKEKLAAQDTVDVLYLPVNANGNFQLTQDTEMSPVDVLVNAQSISSWQDHFSENARIVTYVAEHDASSTDTALTRTSINLSASERSLQTLTGVNILNAETPQTEEASNTFTPTKRDGSGAIFSVTNLSNSGVGSFRQAIIDANSDTGPAPALIKFDVAGTIDLSEQLPFVTGSVYIDAYYGTAQDSGARIILNAAGTSFLDALTFDSANDAFLQGVAIINSTADGLQIQQSDGVVIKNSYFGNDGVSVGQNGGAGIKILTSRNVTIEDNVISGNRREGIQITGNDDGSPDNIFVYSNMIGLDESGENLLGASELGVELDRVNNVHIGLDDARGNYIAGNTRYGIDLNGHDDLVIGGNVIGVTADNQVAGNRTSGIYISGGGNNLTVGLDSALGSTGNVVSNSLTGISLLSSAELTSTKFAGNFIGTDLTGNVAMGNVSHGIQILGKFTDFVIGSPEPGGGNVISGNGGSGIDFRNVTTSGVSIDNNHIGVSFDGNTELGNGRYGISIDRTSFTTAEIVIGSRTVTSGDNGNLIAGNHSGEIELDGNVGAKIYSNTLGVLDDGSEAINSAEAIVAVGNLSEISIGSADGGNTFGSYETAISLSGSTAAGGEITHNNFGSGPANVNAQIGVELAGTTSDIYVAFNRFHYIQQAAVFITDNAVRNTNFNNRYFGVDGLFTDLDSNNANGGLNAPVINSIERVGANSVEVSGTFNAEVSTDYRVEVFLLEENLGDGSLLLSAGTYRTDSSGMGDIELTINQSIRDGEIAISITEDAGVNGLSHSSEFSQPFEIEQLPASIGPVNDLNNTANSVDEGMPIGTVVGITAEAIDPNASDTVTYSLLNSAGVPFAIDPSNGVVTTTQIFDVETDANTEYNITVLAESSDGTDALRTFTINVLNVNEFTPDVDSQNITIDENTQSGIAIATVTATDDDANSVLQQYSIASGNNDGLFQLDSNTGELSLSPGATLDAETQTQHILMVTVSDGDNVSTAASITINVTDVNEHSATKPSANTVDFSATFSVTNLNSSGLGSFRQAIIDANNDTGPGTALIKFDVAGTINVSSTLPDVTGSIHIDAYHGTNEVSGARIILNKSFGSGDTLTIASGDNSLIQGIAFVNGGADGLQIENSDGVIIRNSYFGTDGEALAGNRGSGININTSRNITIENNVISGNRFEGIKIAGINDGNADNIFICNNMIGLNESGDAKLGNGASGIRLQNVNTVYIGLDDNSGNYIADNGAYGISLANFENVTIGGNVIGVTADNQAAGNARSNIYVTTGGSDLTIGSGVTLGSIESTGNVISNSGDSGIEFPSSGAAFFSSVRIAGNYIGTDITGNVAMGNDDWGIRVLSTLSDVVIGAPEAGGGNVISANGRDGIVLTGSPNSNIAIDNNHIGVSADGLIELGNGGYGIDNIHHDAGLTGLVIGSEKAIVNGNPVPGHNGNLIAGNSSGEIRLVGGQDIEILSNTFGELDDGSQAANSDTAIEVSGESSGLIIGGSVAGGNTFGNYRTGTNLDNAEGVGGRITHNRFGSAQANVDNIFGVYIGSDVSDVFIGLNQFYFTQNVAVHLSGSTQGATVFNNRYYGVPNPFTNFASTSSTNNGINAPTLEAASRTGSGGLDINGVFDGEANASYRVEIILLEENIGDGSFVLSAGTYQTDSTGAGEIDLTINNFVREGEIIASITRDDSVTGLAESSEYSDALALDPLPASAPIGLVDDSDNAVNSVDEEMPIGTVVGITAEANDPDVSDTVTYSLSDDAGGRFAIDPSLGVVSTAQVFDLETDATDVYDITVLASSSDTTTEETTFTITVNDVNEFSITTVTNISSNVYLVPSTVTVGTDVIVEGYVNDRDVSDDLTYSLSSDSSGGRFSIDANTGVVSTMTSLANDVGSVYSMQIQAVSDDGSLKRISVTIEITEGVGAPVDSSAVPNSVPENSAIGTFVGITAEDPNNSASVTYSLLDDAGGRFAIDAMSGEVTTADVFDVETDPSTTYDIIVLASSTDGSEASSTFSILIEDVNEFTPQMSSETFNVSEGITSGALIGPLEGDDEDNNATLQNYTIVSGNNDSLFQLDANTGELSLSPGASLDAETQTQHILMVSVSDGTNVSQTAPITINVADINDNSVTTPTDSNQLVNTVDASATVGTAVGVTVFAEDADVVDGVLYSLSGPSSGLFTIDAVNGEVTTAVSLAAEAGTLHDITVEATSDDGSMASSVHTISVTAPIGPLTDDNSAGNTVFEGDPIGTEVGITALSVDPDGFDTVSYSLLNSAGVPFAIDPSNGIVTTTQIFDVETDANTQYNITVVAESSDGTKALRTFTINVLNVNEFTPEVDSQNLTIVENTQSGIAIATVTATDDDANATLQNYTIVSGNNDSLFQLDANTGELSLSPGASLDAETQTQHILMVSVSDGTNVSQTAPITINVADVNDNSVTTPTDSNQSVNTVDASATVGTAVGITVFAEDADLVDSVQYSLTGPSSGLFTIDAVNGEVTTAVSLAAEAGTLHDITVEATSDDGSMASSIHTISVTGPIGPVTDENTANNSVAEGSPVNSTVGITAQSIDPDAADTVTYSLLNSAGVPFSINPSTGIITTQQVFDVETDASTEYNITVVAESSDGTKALRTFTIDVLNVNEFTPDVDSQNLTIDENTQSGIAIATVTATDDDTNATLQNYTIVSGNNDSLFQLDANTGELSLSPGASLDAETQTQHILMVSVSDGTNVSQTAPITINVADVNDNSVTRPTDLDPSANTVDASVSVGTPIGITAFAQDADINDGVRYSLIGPSAGLFTIDAINGEVTTALSLEPEAGTFLALTIQATSDDGSITSSVHTVSITAPIGPLTDDNSAGNTVFEGDPIGTEVGITALSDDADINDTVSYSLLNNAVPFAIDPSTGIVTTTQIFDVETDASTEYNITVVAESTDGTQALRTFTINVLNVNEFTPDVDSQILTIVENTQSGIAIATVTATDDDANSALQQYTIVSGNSDSLFQINSNNGQLSVAPGAVIDAETEQQHILMITVSDGNNVSTATPITINVTDVNEHSVSTPVDGNSTGNIVAPDAIVGTSVGITAIAEDLDVSDGVLYSLTNNGNGRFSINSQTGEVSVASSLLSDVGTIQRIVVEATSGDGSTSSQNLFVTVTGPISSLSDSNAAANSVNEGLLAGARVGIQASASDPDASDSITYSLSDDAGGRFAIDDTTGVVTTLMAFDAETDTAFDITAVAESDDGTFSSQTFTVTIVDVNEFAPSINAQTLIISEDTPPITELAELQVTDGDSSFVAQQWTITSGNEEGLFQINPANGKLFLGSGNQLDAETTQQYVLFVSVSDGTNVSLPTPITINITDADEFGVSTPVDLDGSINKVEFDAPLASSIGFAAFAQDADITDSVSYALSDDANGRFVINPLTGEVSTAVSLSADNGSQLSFTVEATSTDGSTSSLTASVTVTGPIRALTDVDTNANSVNEGSPVGTSVGVIAQAIDPDTNDTVSYSLSNDAAGRFSIDSNTGVVVTTETFDAETDSEFTITVLAESSDGSTSSQSFTIAITDVNEFVPEVLAQVITVSESSPALTEIGQLQASDNDITYTAEQWTINSGNADGVFQINSDNGRLFIAPGGQLDAEADQQHVLFVSVFDGDNVSAPVPIVVNVSDENENSVSALVDADVTANIVASSAPAGTSIGFTALAEDSDVNDDVTYSLIDDGNGRFSINQITGEVSKASSVAADAGTTQSFTVEATSSDGSTSLLTDSVNVTGPTGQVMDVDSNINTVDWTAPIGSTVGITANATDPDASDSITYSLLNNLSGTFSIDPVSGVITTAGPLGAYAGTQHNLFIEATSSDGSTDIGSFAVEVTAPITAISDIDSDVNGIDEELPAGSNVGITVQAIDPDTTDLVTYSLIDDADGRFAIDPVSGVVTTTTPLSAESATTWDIEAAATSSDGSSESQGFTISIADVNEFSVSEIVDLDSAENEVAESIAIGSSVGITANAVDTDLSDSVSYSIDGEEQSLFSIDSVTGEVSTNAALDFEEQTNHQVNVTATSSDGSTSTSVFTVNVMNVNEYEPVVITDNISIEENTSDSVIAVLSASDADGLTSFSDWQIESGNEGNLFVLDEATGELSIAPGVVVDHETADEYELLVSVSDGISRSEPTLITITIEDQNETPIFEGAEFNTTTDFIGSIGQLEVTDPDTGDTHTFAIQSADSTELFLSPDGLLFQQDLLEQGAFEVPVQVVDAAGESASGIILLNVVESEPAPQPLLGEAMPLVDTVTIQPTLEVADTLSVSELLSTNANNQSDTASEAPVEQEMVAAPEASIPSIPSSPAASEEFVEVVEDALFETNESSAEIDDFISDDNFNNADPFSRYNGNPAGALRLNPIDLRLNNNLNDPLTGLSIGELGGNRRLVMNILVNADKESSVELSSLSNVFVNQYVGSAFSPQLINALQGVSDELETEAAAVQKQEDLRVTTTTFVSSVLTVGFVTWLLQSGSLVATAMTTAPLWQGLDPIPVLANSGSDSDSEF